MKCVLMQSKLSSDPSNAFGSRKLTIANFSTTYSCALIPILFFPKGENDNELFQRMVEEYERKEKDSPVKWADEDEGPAREWTEPEQSDVKDYEDEKEDEEMNDSETEEGEKEVENEANEEDEEEGSSHIFEHFKPIITISISIEDHS